MSTFENVVGMAILSVDNDASCIITHAYQPCLLQKIALLDPK